MHLQTHFDSRFSKDGLIHSYSLSSSQVPGSARMQFYQASKGNHVSTEMAFAEALPNSSTYIRYGCSEWHTAALLWSTELHWAVFMQSNPE